MQSLAHVVLAPSAVEDEEEDGGALRILQLTDLHLFPPQMSEWKRTPPHKGVRLDVTRENGRTPYSTSACLKLCAKLSAAVRPHLVVLTGDVIDGRPYGELNLGPEAWRADFQTLIAPLVTAGIAWTFIPGNHDDDDSPWSRDDLIGVYSLPGCASRGATSFNHTFTVSVGASGARTRLFFFDTGGNDQMYSYGTVAAEAVASFARFAEEGVAEAETSSVAAATATAAAASANNGLAFYHIPLPETAALDPVIGHQGLFNAALSGGKVPKPWCWVPSIVRLLGKDRVVGASKLNSGLFDAIASAGTVRSCFFGHDHHSDAVFQRRGVYLAYGRVSSCLPPSDWEGKSPLPFAPGGRVIEVRRRADEPESRISTWVVTASGEAASSRLVLRSNRDGDRDAGSAAPPRLRLATKIVFALIGGAALFAGTAWWQRRTARRVGGEREETSYEQSR